MSDPGALGRAVEVMDWLRSPGGCPWDASQTHRSLARYLLEETYEVLEAIETDDPTLLREELGDLLLQVLFHARLAEELPPGTAFDIEDVAGDLVAKLVRRHPHVFAVAAGDPTVDPGVVDATWEAQKILEKGRTSVLDGVPSAQPALALAAKLVSRVARTELVVDLPSADDPAAEIGHRLFALVSDAVGAGIDPEGALREVIGDYRRAVLLAEGAPGMQNPSGSTGGTTGRVTSD